MNHIINNALIEKIAPSIFATKPWERMSEHYGFVPTIEVIDMLRREGFAVTRVMQSRTRIEGKAPFTKHMVRMRHLSYIDQPAQEIPEIVIINSHDGRCSYQFHAGIFRLVCCNGLIVKSSDFGNLKMKHVGGDSLQSEVLHVSRQIIDHAPLALNRIERWKETELTRPQQEAFAAAAAELKEAAIRPAQLLEFRRHADNRNDLWTTANRIQENLIRGGLYVRSPKGRLATTRPVKSVDGDVKLNQAIWTLTERLEKLVASTGNVALPTAA